MKSNEIFFRSSRTGDLMTNPRSKSEMISETAKQFCIDSFIQYKYGRKKDIQNKYIQKGLEVEEDAITLYSRVTKTFFKKNESNLKNDFITGTPDIFIGDSIDSADIVIDIKSSWDIFTFFKAKTAKEVDKKYYWQLQSYMWLTGAKSAKLAYCLIDTPFVLINDEKRRFMWKAMQGDENELTDEVFALIEKNMTFGDIPLNERLHELTIERNDDHIHELQQRVELCRKWIGENLL